MNARMNSVTDMFSMSTSAPGANADLTSLFENYRHLLVGFVTRYTRCHADAEDVVQTAFVQALSTGAGWPAQATLPRSMFGTALMLARDARDERAQERAALPDAAAHDPLAQSDPVELIMLRQLKEKL